MRALGPVVLALPLLGLGAAAWAGPKPLPADLKMDGSEQIEAPKGHDALRDARWCRVCHPAERFAVAAWAKTAHREQTCVDCHDGYHFNPHLPVALGPGATDSDEGSTPEKRRAHARARCDTCHTEERTPAIDAVVHGDQADAPGKPTCADCHGEPHGIEATEGKTPPQLRLEMNARCIRCHADEARMEAAGLTTRSVDTYHHSVHGRQLDLGSQTSPGCVDCHGGHTLTNLEKDGVAVCQDCHASATADFVQHADHRRFTRDERPISFFTLKFFAWLTFLTIFALSLHVLLDVFASLRQALRGGRGGDA